MESSTKFIRGKNGENEELVKNLTSKGDQPSISTSAEFPDTNPAKRMSITLAGDIADYLERWAKAEHVSINELIRRAISTEIFLQKEIRSGSKLLLHRNDNQISEIIFR